MDNSFTSCVINCSYMELVKLKAVKDKVTFTLTRDVKVVLQADRVSLTKIVSIDSQFFCFPSIVKGGPLCCLLIEGHFFRLQRSSRLLIRTCDI